MKKLGVKEVRVRCRRKAPNCLVLPYIEAVPVCFHL